jgi:sRNA-binding carbon storage regulator CsrA
MALRAWSAAAVLAAIAGCSSPEHSRAPVLPGESAPVSHPPPPTPTGESDDDTALETWRMSVLARADGDTLNLIRKDIEARIQKLQENDVRLSYMAPGLVLDERTRIARRLAYEKKRLVMVDER